MTPPHLPDFSVLQSPCLFIALLSEVILRKRRRTEKVAGEMKAIDVSLDYGVHPDGECVGTATTLGPCSSVGYDSSQPLAGTRAQAEALSKLVFRFATEIVPCQLKQQFLVEFDGCLKRLAGQ
jgi:hypothetical protein